MDRIDKILLILPLLPMADLISTLFSLRFGGEEIGILARPILLRYGSVGLGLLAGSASLIFLFSMCVVIYIKGLFIADLGFKWARYFLAIPIFWFFVLEGVYVSTVTLNFLVPVIPTAVQAIGLRVTLVCSYFMCVNVLTMPHIRRLRSFQA